MSAPFANRSLVIIGLITGVITIGSNLVTMGELKGNFSAILAQHSKELEQEQALNRRQDESIANLKTTQQVIESRLHGISSNIGREPGKVAQKLNEANEVED